MDIFAAINFREMLFLAIVARINRSQRNESMVMKLSAKTGTKFRGIGRVD